MGRRAGHQPRCWEERRTGRRCVRGDTRGEEGPPHRDEPGSGGARGAVTAPAALPDERRTLLDRHRLEDVARKVVGIGSVGTRCWIALFATADEEPLVLQIEEATRSVLEPYAGESARIRDSAWWPGSARCRSASDGPSGIMRRSRTPFAPAESNLARPNARARARSRGRSRSPRARRARRSTPRSRAWRRARPPRGEARRRAGCGTSPRRSARAARP